MVKFNIKNVNKLVVEENDCYTYTRLTHKKYFIICNVSYIIFIKIVYLYSSYFMFVY